MKNPLATIPPFMGIRLIDHVEHAILILRVHGLMSDSERDKIRSRVDKAIKKWETNKPNSKE